MLRLLVLAALLLITLFWAMTATAATGRRFAAPQSTDLSVAIAVTPTGVITVTTTDDEVNNDGNCSLREAIQAAATDSATDACPAGDGHDTILLPAGEYLLTLGEILLTGTIMLQGSLSDTTILDADHQSRVLSIDKQATITLRNLDIRNGSGRDGAGGGIANFGTVWLAYSTVHDNKAGSIFEIEVAGGAPGGGIYNEGILTATNSTISTNAAGDGGCITHGGIPGCTHGGSGGGIANLGRLTLDNATVTRNQPGSTYNYVDNVTYFGTGGGVYNQGTTTIKNSIIAGNIVDDCSGELSTIGTNVIQVVNDCTTSGHIIPLGAHLGLLRDNGGPTLTHALEKSSSAIDAGDCLDSAGITVTVDQRGEPRPQGESCDIGAYESSFTSTFAISNMSLPLIGFNQ